MKINQFCAKSDPFQSVPTHGLVSGITAQVLFSEFLSANTAEKLARLLGLSVKHTSYFLGYLISLHDIGKLSPQFAFHIAPPALRETMMQEGLAPSIPERQRHEKTTQRILKTLWREQGCDKRSGDYLAGVLGAHHQGKVGDWEDDDPCWKRFQIEMEKQMRLFFCPDASFSLPTIPSLEPGFLGCVLLGLTILADWIASSAAFAYAEEWITEEHIRETIQLRVKTFLQKSGLSRQAFSFGDTFCSVWPMIPPTGVRPLQRQTEALFQQTNEKIALLLLEAPMGEGKTEAGMYAALRMAEQWKKNGFYVGLPTAATSNQMVERIRLLLEQNKVSERVRLLHAMAWLTDEENAKSDRLSIEDAETEDAALRWLEPVRRGLLGSYAVGTVDQAMMSVLLVKYGVLRLLGLSGKVLIIDELHAYDAYMSEILRSLLEWCKALEIPVVLLSATLPLEKKQEMLSPFTDKTAGTAYPAVTAVTASGDLQTLPILTTARQQKISIQLHEILHQPAEIARLAHSLTTQGGCLCILLNTVRQAQEVYRALQEQKTDAELLLFHAQFPAAQRDRIEKKCLRLFGPDKTSRPDKAILVSTQVVEQSLDIDMDWMMTAAAPMDLILQRTGRMFRHDNTPRPASAQSPVLHVLLPSTDDFGADSFVYPECLLRQSIYLLRQKHEIRIPEDLAQLVADGYDSEKAPPGELESWLERLMDDQLQRGQSSKYLLGSPGKAFRPVRERIDFDDLEQSGYLSAKTRFGEPSRRIALLEPMLFQQLASLSEPLLGKPCVCLRNSTLARTVWEQSVSIRETHLKDLTPGLIGGGLLAGIDIFPSHNGIYRSPDGREIIFDPEYGVLWKGIL